LIDVHVGSRVRLRRRMLRLSQEKLGQALGISFQQVQKYERGANRIGASRLLEMARLSAPLRGLRCALASREQLVARITDRVAAGAPGFCPGPAQHRIGKPLGILRLR
jgi:transcriptional regulator with XRE-family HTH domain